jgi:predicted nucleic acid-binding protein
VIRTYVDSCVLLDAWTGRKALAQRALEILDDPGREYLSSIFVRLETVPLASYHKNDLELAFYQAFFDSVTAWAMDLDAVVGLGEEAACRFGLSATDALHIAAASLLGADEFITTERADIPTSSCGSCKDHYSLYLSFDQLWN